MSCTASWRPGCPVGPENLRRLKVAFWAFDGSVQEGDLIVHADLAGEMVAIFRDLFSQGFPIERMVPVDVYGGSDDRSMAANNTSAFNCRFVAGTSTWSRHAFGSAIDINPVQNPYVSGSTVSPPAGKAHLNRSNPAPGKILVGDGVVRAFTNRGWEWGGNWSSPKDYQHFQRAGSPSRPIPVQAGLGMAATSGRLDIVVRTATGSIVHQARTSGGWAAPVALGGYSDSAPDLAASSGGRLDAVVLGGDGAVWHRSHTGGAWGAWSTLGGLVRSGPSVASSPTGDRIDVFAIGMDRALWTNTFTGSWTGWRSLGGVLTSDPDVVANVSAGRLDVFARGSDRAIWQRSFVNGMWGPWVGVGGVSTSGPAAASRAVGTLDVFTRGTNGELYGNSFTAGGWSGWFGLGGLLSSDPDAGAIAGGPLTVAVAGIDDQLWSRELSGTWSNWHPLM